MSDFILDEVDIAPPNSTRTISLIPKKVYLIDADNGESYEDYYHAISKVFSTYRGAAQWLVSEGYEPFYSYDFSYQEHDVMYYWQEDDQYGADCSFAKIIEMDLEE
jgi:hypothetical protein